MTGLVLGSVYASHATLARDRRWPAPGCEGFLKVQEVTGVRRPAIVVECDGCGLLVGVGARSKDRAERDEPRPPEQPSTFEAGF